MKRILFVCVENAGRSQMAEAFARLYGTGKIEAMSAGTMPAREVNPVVAEAMREEGLDISGNRPKAITPDMVREADVIITMGCSAEGFCPVQFLDKVIDWKLDDPKGKPIEQVRKIRDELEKKVKELIEDLK